MREGYGALESGEFERAVSIADRLEAMRHSSGFEIGARAQWGLNNQKEAIDILCRGTGKVPQLSILWHYLGCYQSDAGDLEEALKSLNRALQCADADRAVELFNIAIVLQRQHRYADALRALESLAPDEEEPPTSKRLGLRAELLLALDRTAEAVDCLARALDSPRGDDVERARLMATRSSLRLRTGERGGAIADALAAIELNSTCDSAAWALRCAEDQRSNRSQYIRVLVEGIWYESIEAEFSSEGFHTSFDVIADDLGEAMGFIRRFVPSQSRATLRIDQHEYLEDRPDEPKGVVRATAYYIFPREEDGP